MRILFISKDLLAGNLARVLVEEGHDVTLYIQDQNRRGNFHNIVHQTDDWIRELSWVGTDGLIVFDDVGFAGHQEALRNHGYSVCGGSELGEKLESNRRFGQDIFRVVGMQTVPLVDFNSPDEAIAFLKSVQGEWVIKQNSADKDFNFVGNRTDARDTISMLENYRDHSRYETSVISLHQRVRGIEIGVARYFNGTDWVGPIEMSVEHKRLFPGDLGPATMEMGTVAWYDDVETNKLFTETLAKLKPFLRHANFRGDMSVNCIVNESGAFPLEATARFGAPIIHLQRELHQSPWGTFLKAVADGEPHQLKYTNGFGIVVVLALPPFPYHYEHPHVSCKGVDVTFRETIHDQIHDHIHFEDIARRTKHHDPHEYYVSDSRGYALYVTGSGPTITDARNKTYERIKHIHIPKMYYRNDIGTKFETEELPELKRLGYV